MRTAIALIFLLIAVMLIAARVPATSETPDRSPIRTPIAWRRTADGWQRADRWTRSANAAFTAPDLPDPIVVSAVELAAAIAALAVGRNVKLRSTC